MEAEAAEARKTKNFDHVLLRNHMVLSVRDRITVLEQKIARLGRVKVWRVRTHQRPRPLKQAG
ncbi:MAG: hypothetical protein INR68_05280 [Methylobacterium mesophilicum]|nr:hypothetical protein [Methylobacterium mesophilicum]